MLTYIVDYVFHSKNCERIYIFKSLGQTETIGSCIKRHGKRSLSNSLSIWRGERSITIKARLKRMKHLPEVKNASHLSPWGV